MARVFWLLCNPASIKFFFCMNYHLCTNQTVHVAAALFQSRDIASAGCRLPAPHQDGWVIMGVDVVALSATIHAKVNTKGLGNRSPCL